jgi:hypothetical protein
MHRVITTVLLSAAMSACGLADSGAAATTAAQSAAQQAAQARQNEDRVRQQVDAAYGAAEQQRRAAESQAQ